jgi:hypothetical protein
MAGAIKAKGLTRREFVKAGALAAGAAVVLPVGAARVASAAPAPTQPGAPAVGDAFWKQFSGTTLKVLMHDHPYQLGLHSWRRCQG